MARYIDAEMACAEVDKGDLLVGNNADFAKEIIRRTPSVDVVEVVRCKDCKHRHIPVGCALWYGTCGDADYFCEHGDDFFCSHGERKE